MLSDDELSIVVALCGCRASLFLSRTCKEMRRRVFSSFSSAPWPVPTDCLRPILRLGWPCPEPRQGRIRVDLFLLKEMLRAPPCSSIRISGQVYTPNAAAWHLQLTRHKVDTLSLDVSRFCKQDASYVLYQAIRFARRCSPRSVVFADARNGLRIPRPLILCATESLEVYQVVRISRAYLQAFLGGVRAKRLRLRSPFSPPLPPLNAVLPPCVVDAKVVLGPKVVASL